MIPVTAVQANVAASKPRASGDDPLQTPDGLPEAK